MDCDFVAAAQRRLKVVMVSRLELAIRSVRVTTMTTTAARVGRRGGDSPAENRRYSRRPTLGPELGKLIAFYLTFHELIVVFFTELILPFSIIMSQFRPFHFVDSAKIEPIPSTIRGGAFNNVMTIIDYKYVNCYTMCCC